MTENEGLEREPEETADLVEEVLAEPLGLAGYRLLDVQFRNEGGWVLRLTVDREQGITLDGLSEVSELAGRVLDVEDPITQSYSLEATSPGLFRPLRKRKHYEQSIGKEARLTLAPGYCEDRKQRTLRGVITAVEDQTVRLEVKGKSLEFPLEGIRSARLDPKL